MCKGARQGRLRRLSPARKSHHDSEKVAPAETTIPNHQELDRGTLRAIIRQAGLTVEEFTALL